MKFVVLKMFPGNSTNFSIFYNNLSTYYVICLLTSIVAVLLSWKYHFKYVPYDDNIVIEPEKVSRATSKEDLEEKEGAEFKNILNSFNETKKQTIEKVAASLTEDQLEEERKIEREQLSAILKLLQEQEEKFQVTSMEELEGQLKLYR